MSNYLVINLNSKAARNAAAGVLRSALAGLGVVLEEEDAESVYHTTQELAENLDTVQFLREIDPHSSEDY